ncbi:AAA domain-containing protein [Mycotypha africana]|uniref:AAA domain-containing protein n=1 Tax=Mycotypha africana TaxID=64632 RepID=UPI002300C384|nr:AAA domain-containing protein [Mycotypha africana]KAI8979724.1 AAA domain-containing protein [Mycotypha africana]
MSHIESMAILGVRSFSPDEPSYIRFQSPLTLIVGPNGSGKTSIIECLRYACTGDFPPNSRGGAFVHDPKLAGSDEVKAQIKLKFYSVNGQKMICSRSLSVTKRGKTYSQKAIDNALLRYDPITGEAFSITSRCADMDLELPLHLGVTKAILDNVIFCHQEDSNWPLSESSILKKKFDDIFASKRYVVALEEIKSLRKEITQETKIANVQLDSLKEKAAKAKRIRNDLTQLNQQLNGKQEKLQAIENEIERVSEETVRLNSMLRDIANIEEQIQTLIHKKDFFESTMRSIESHIVPSDKSTEALKKLLEDHQLKENQNQMAKTDMAKQKQECERKLKKLQDGLSQKHTEMGRLEAAQEEYERQIASRTELIRRINEKNNLELSEEDGSAAAAELKEFMIDLNRKNSKLKEEAVARQNNLSDDVQMLKSRELSIDENRKHLERQIADDQIRIEAITQKIATYRVSEPEIEALEKRIIEYEKKLSNMNDSTDKTNQEQLKVKERELKALDEEIIELNDELARLSKQSDAQARLSLKHKDKETKETTVNQIYNANINAIAQLLGHRPDIANLFGELGDYSNKKGKELATHIEIRNKANRELSAADAKLNMVKQNYQIQKKEFDKYHAAVKEICGNKDLPQELLNMEKKLTTWNEKLHQMEGCEMIYKRYAETQRKSGCCPLCTREFNDEQEINTFQQQLETMQSFIPGQKRTLQEQLHQLQRRKERYQSAQDTWVKMNTLKKDLETIENNMNKLKNERESCANRVDVSSADFVEVNNSKIKADQLLLVASNVNRIYNEVKVLTEDINDLESELRVSGLRRTIGDVQKELEHKSDESKSIHREIKRINQDMTANNSRKQAIELSLSDYRAKKMNLESKLNFKIGLQLQREELEEQKNNHENEIKNADRDRIPLKRQLEVATEKYEAAIKEMREVEEKASAETNAISLFLDRLTEVNSSLLRTARINSPENVNRLKNEIAELEENIKQFTTAINTIDEKVAIFEKDEAERKGIERDLQDQIKYREMKEGLQVCQQELSDLRQRQTENTSGDLKTDLNKARDKESELLDKRGSIRGEIGQIREQIRRYENELSNEYADVDGQYGRLFIETRVKELGNLDLEKYSKVLQTAITKYHALKMEDLNRIIKQLWIETYKGGDIDYIEVRADSDGTGSSRSLNYRVVMIKEGQELVMRGRCSAGQKVLAAIIIRLALAETFCINCGIFTLDEPTTNLDRANIEALAESLKKIIENRSKQANFQFIIITHDEEFVNCLKQSSILDTYYRVHKDHGTNSIITIQSVSGLPFEEDGHLSNVLQQDNEEQDANDL